MLYVTAVLRFLTTETVYPNKYTVILLFSAIVASNETLYAP